MTMPKHNEIRYIALKQLVDGEAKTTRNLEKPLAMHFQLTEEETEAIYQSGNGLIFLDRISWAMSFLYRNGYVDKPKRAIFQINDVGKSILTRADAQDFLFNASNKSKSKSKSELILENIPDNEKTPLEILSDSFNEIKSSVFDEILTTVISKSPREFEHLVVALLECMGYGGQVQDAGRVTQATNDAGIDGIIKEDILGLGRIYTWQMKMLDFRAK